MAAHQRYSYDQVSGEHPAEEDEENEEIFLQMMNEIAG